MSFVNSLDLWWGLGTTQKGWCPSDFLSTTVRSKEGILKTDMPFERPEVTFQKFTKLDHRLLRGEAPGLKFRELHAPESQAGPSRLDHARQRRPGSPRTCRHPGSPEGLARSAAQSQSGLTADLNTGKKKGRRYAQGQLAKKCVRHARGQAQASNATSCWQAAWAGNLNMRNGLHIL